MASGGREEDVVEKLRLEVEAELMYLTVEGLSVVAEELEIRQGRYRNRGKLVILREIRNQLDKNEVDPEMDSVEGLRVLQTLVRGLLDEPQFLEGTQPGHQSQRRSVRSLAVNYTGGQAVESSSESDARSVASGGSGSDAHA